MSPASGALQSYCVIIHAAGVSSGGPSCQVSVVGLHEAFVHHAEMKDPMLFFKRLFFYDVSYCVFRGSTRFYRIASDVMNMSADPSLHHNPPLI